MVMCLRLLFALLALVAIQCRTTFPSLSPDALRMKAELGALLNDQSVAVRTGDRLEVEYAPENTGYVFSSPRAHAFDDMRDYVELYLYFLADHADLRERLRAQRRAVEGVGSKPGRAECTARTPRQAALCRLESIGRALAVEVSTVRYDEGVRVVTPIDVPAHLAVAKEEGGGPGVEPRRRP